MTMNNLVAVKLGDIGKMQSIICRISLVRPIDAVVEIRDVNWSLLMWKRSLFPFIEIPLWIGLRVASAIWVMGSTAGWQYKWCVFDQSNINLSLTRENGKIKISWNQGEYFCWWRQVPTQFCKGKLSQSLAIMEIFLEVKLILSSSDLKEILWRKSNNGFYLYQNQPVHLDTYTNSSFMLPKMKCKSLKLYEMSM